MANSTNKQRVFLVDDHPLVREWLTNLINEEPDFEVCGKASDTREALGLIGSLQPKIVVVDISLEGGSGLELIKDVKAVHPKVDMIVLSMHDEMLYAERALRAGARGYIMKRETAKKIILAIRQMLGGKIYMSDSLSASFAEKFVDGRLLTSGSLVDQLTDRELEVFQLLGKGCETRQVAQMMTVSMKTVQAHCAHIKEKLKLTNAAELLREAVRWQENNPTS